MEYKIKKHLLTFLFLIIMEFFSYAQNGKSNSEIVKPNFIFILADDLGWNELSIEMDPRNPLSKSTYIESPNLEWLAEDGIVFSNAYCSAPLCTPSRRSILFGMTPARQKGTEFVSQFDPAPHLSIPQMLKKINKDYVTAHYGKWGEVIVGNRKDPESEKPGYPDKLGFDYSDGKTTNKTGTYYDRDDKDNYYRNFKCEAAEDPKLTFSITNRACDFLKQQKKSNNPFYLQVSYYAIHTAAQARLETMKKYEEKGPIPIQASDGIAPMIEDMDAGIGMILDTLEELGLEENTYVFFTSDNGGEKLPNDLIDHSKFKRNMPLRKEKQWLYEGGVRVPFIVRGPKITPGIHSAEPIVGYDLWMTLYDLAGGEFKVSSEIDGISFKNALLEIDGGNLKRRKPGIIFHRPKRQFTWPGTYSAIRRGDYKLVVDWETEEKFLYKVSLDISERYNLADENRRLTKKLYKSLVNYLKEVDADGKMYYDNPY